MTSLTLALVSIIVLFVGFLFLRSLFSWSVCALCAGVLVTWITLLALLKAGFMVDPLVVAILMGASGVGMMYFLEEVLEDKYHVFRLAFFATVITATHLLISERFAVGAVIALLVLWLVSFGLFLKRNNKNFKEIVAKIIRCCKNR